jgi:uncharacterized repeat protein (TIGR01451 family)
MKQIPVFKWLSNLVVSINTAVSHPPTSPPDPYRLHRLAWPILVCLLLGLLFLLPWHSQAQTNETPGATETTTTLQQADNSGLIFHLELPSAQVADETIAVAGLTAALHEPGAPALPYYTTWLAVPPGADVASVTVNETAVSTRHVGPIQAAPQHGSQPITDLPHELREAYAQLGIEAIPMLVEAPDLELYGRSQAYPAQSYHLSEPMYYRDIQLVALHLYPLRYNPVTQELSQAQQLTVRVNFSQTDRPALHRLPTANPGQEQALANRVLNYEQSQSWRGVPARLLQSDGPGLPIGTDVYKIAVDQSGIYEISGAELAAQGMNLGSIDPHTIEMMHRGQPVAYAFVGDPDDGFQPTDRIRFFGWAFDGPRLEKQFVADNIFWLWAGGSASTIAPIANEAGQGYAPHYSFQDEIIREPEHAFYTGQTNQWDTFDNEPDAWYWENVTQNVDILTRTHMITLPHPALTGPDAQLLVEMLSREQSTAPTNFVYDVRARLNNSPEIAQRVWDGVRNVNITGTLPVTALAAGVQPVDVVYATDPTASAGNPRYLLNRITVTYERRLTAVSDQLIFGKDSPNPVELRLNNYSQNDPDQVLIWEISDRHQPRQVAFDAGHISGSGPYTYTVGSSQAAGSRYIALTEDNVQTVKSLSAYTPTTIEPDGGADWVIISHDSLLTAAYQLAAHRANPNFGHLSTHVVDVADIINQYGYGLPMPEAIRHYLSHGLATWDIPPSYVVLLGNGTNNPRQLECNDCPNSWGWWDSSVPNRVPTDLVFKDRYQGMIPSDHTFTTLVGDDLLPDLAVGRLVAYNLSEAQNIVNKIIQHDTNQRTPAEWQHRYLFVADTTDQGGNFCLANQQIGNNLPSSIDQIHLCRPAKTVTDTNQIRADMSTAVHDPDQGISLLNYRGHGSIDNWASSPVLFTVFPVIETHPNYDTYIATMNFWQNNGKPVIILSADCLDGNFAYPGFPALSETFMALEDVGTAAHWSSTGLGFTFEHSVLLRELYEGAFDLGLAALGDAISYSKTIYLTDGYHESEAYSFVLQGDPAMQLYRPDLRLEKTTPQTNVEPGDTVQFDLTVHNDGLYAVTPTVVDTLPDGLTFTGYEATLSTTLTQTGQELTFAVGENMDWGDQFTITIYTAVDPETDGQLVNTAQAAAPGWDLNPANRQDSASVTSVYSPPIDYTDFIYLPYITR